VIDQAEKLRQMMREKKVESLSAGTHKPARKKSKTGTCRSIAITSGKGGVGKSNTAVSLACALTLLNKRVLVFDGDLGLANIHILLGIAPKYNLSHVIREECTITETLCEGPCGITIIPGSSGILSMANIELNRLELLIRDLTALEAGYDFLLIDGGAGIGHTSIQLSSMADYTLLMITPEPTSLADAYSVAKILFARGIKRIDVLVNMAETEKEGRQIFDKIRLLVKNFLKKDLALAGIIPFDKAVSKYIRIQKNIFNEKRSSAIAKNIHSVALRLCGMQQVKAKGFFARLFSDTPVKGAVQ
jgi:flagellar biosynthesis protein FlhG